MFSASALYLFWPDLKLLLYYLFQRIPIWWRWYYWANPVAWSLYGLQVSQYGDDNKLVKLSDGINSVAIHDVLKHVFGFRHDFLGVAAIMVFGFCLFFATIFAFAIKSFNFQRRWEVWFCLNKFLKVINNVRGYRFCIVVCIFQITHCILLAGIVYTESNNRFYFHKKKYWWVLFEGWRYWILVGWFYHTLFPCNQLSLLSSTLMTPIISSSFFPFVVFSFFAAYKDHSKQLKTIPISTKRRERWRKIVQYQWGFSSMAANRCLPCSELYILSASSYGSSSSSFCFIAIHHFVKKLKKKRKKNYWKQVGFLRSRSCSGLK